MGPPVPAGFPAQTQQHDTGRPSQEAFQQRGGSTQVVVTVFCVFDALAPEVLIREAAPPRTGCSETAHDRPAGTPFTYKPRSRAHPHLRCQGAIPLPEITQARCQSAGHRPVAQSPPKCLNCPNLNPGTLPALSISSHENPIKGFGPCSALDPVCLLTHPGPPVTRDL